MGTFAASTWSENRSADPEDGSLQGTTGTRHNLLTARSRFATWRTHLKLVSLFLHHVLRPHVMGHLPVPFSTWERDDLVVHYHHLL
jgi:hypothetical protein